MLYPWGVHGNIGEIKSICGGCQDKTKPSSIPSSSNNTKWTSSFLKSGYSCSNTSKTEDQHLFCLQNSKCCLQKCCLPLRYKSYVTRHVHVWVYWWCGLEGVESTAHKSLVPNDLVPFLFTTIPTLQHTHPHNQWSMGPRSTPICFYLFLVSLMAFLYDSSHSFVMSFVSFFICVSQSFWCLVHSSSMTFFSAINSMNPF